MDELNCPFCGNSVEIWDTAFGTVNVVECKACQTRFVFPWHRHGEELYKFWNGREKKDANRDHR